MDAIINNLSQYGIIYVAILGILDYACIPMYPAVAFPALGVLAGMGIINQYICVAVAVLASLIPTTLIYFLSLKFQNGIEKFIHRNKLLTKSYKKAEGFITKHGRKGILLGRFLPVVRIFITIPAGILKMDFPIYMFYTLIGNIIFGVTNFVLGYFFGNFFFPPLV